MGSLIGFDFDAVIARTDLVLCYLLSLQVGRVVSPESITMYELQDCLPELSDEQVRNCIDQLVSTEHTFNMPPYPGAMDFLKWYGKRNRIVIITNRPNLEPVDTYLNHNLDSYTYDKVDLYYEIEKGRTAKALGIKYFIEDKIQNIVNLANHGIIPIVFKQNWNKDVISQRSNLSDLCIFVDNWNDIYHAIGCELFGY